MQKFARNTLSRALGLALLGVASSTAFAQQQAATPAADTQSTQAQAEQAQSTQDQVTELDRVVASGFRQSLEYSTMAKREASGFVDAIYAEDIGKFPDVNIAESLARIPGIQLNRDVNGEGLNVAIRGLPSSFTKTTINGQSVATASIGLDAQNANREVDLNLFPTEFFTQLKVYKSPTAALTEGGASGVVDMRNVRPFDNPESQVTYSLQADYNDVSEKTSPRGTVIGSWLNDDKTFGVLVGVTSQRGHIGVDGYETVGWTNPNLTNAQCGNGAANGGGFPALGQPCNVTGGNGWRIPDSIASRVAESGLVQRLDVIKQKHRRIRTDKLDSQLGTLGGGNHFIEICLDEADAVWVMLHSGSRGTGNLIGTYFIERAREALAHRVLGFHLPDKDLAFFMQGEPLFDDYVEAVSWAQDYARHNREAMMARVLAEMRHRLPKFQLEKLAVNCHHNYVQKETHGGQELLVTRKGAVSVREGELGIIPGSMGTRSYIVRGKGNTDSFHSCSHGGGRVMSRTAARQRITLAQHREATAHVECRKDEGVIDESPAAYKSIDAVMAAQTDLVEVVHTLRQVVCIKG